MCFISFMICLVSKGRSLIQSHLGIFMDLINEKTGVLLQAWLDPGAHRVDH